MRSARARSATSVTTLVLGVSLACCTSPSPSGTTIDVVDMSANDLVAVDIHTDLSGTSETAMDEVGSDTIAALDSSASDTGHAELCSATHNTYCNDANPCTVDVCSSAPGAAEGQCLHKTDSLASSGCCADVKAHCTGEFEAFNSATCRCAKKEE